MKVSQYPLDSVSCTERPRLLSGAILCEERRTANESRLYLQADPRSSGFHLPFTSQDGSVMDRTPGMASNVRTRRVTGARARGASMTCTKLTVTQRVLLQTENTKIVRSDSPAVSTRECVASKASPLTPITLSGWLHYIYVRAFVGLQLDRQLAAFNTGWSLPDLYG